MKKLLLIILAFGLLATPVLAETRVDGVEYGTVGEMRVKRYGDTLKALLDGTDAFMKWSDGDLTLMTDEGTNTTSVVTIKGKGTGTAELKLLDGSGADYNTVLSQFNGVLRFLPGALTTEIVFNELGADVDFRVESDTMPNAFFIDGATGDVTGQTLATSNQHKEIGLMLALLQTPVAVVGFTGTGATTTTENGYESGTGRVWTYSGGLTTDKIFKGQTYVYSFDGTDSYLSTPDTADMSFGDGSSDSKFSVGGWVEFVNGSTNRVMIAKHDGTSGSTQKEWMIQISSTENLSFYLYDDSEDVNCNTVTGALSAGWHYIVATYDGSGGATAANGLKIYVDGVSVSVTPTNDASYVAMENKTSPVYIGARMGDGVMERFWDGDMGRLFVHPDELDATTIWILYENTRGYYNL